MKNLKKIIILFCFLIIMLSLVGCSFLKNLLAPPLPGEDSQPLAGGTLYLQADEQILAPGEKLEVKLQVTGIKQLKGYSVILAYDPSLLQVIEIKEGSFLSSDNNTFFYQKADVAKGTIQVDSALLGAGLTVSGEGTLATLNCKVLKAETISLSFQQVKARASGNRSLVPTYQNIRLGRKER